MDFNGSFDSDTKKEKNKQHETEERPRQSHRECERTTILKYLRIREKEHRVLLQTELGP